MDREGFQRYMPMAVIGVIVIVVLAVVFILIQSGGDGTEQAASATTSAPSALSGDAAEIAQQRGLTPDDITAALKTYVPSGGRDDYVMFASGGHSGQVFVIGMPSMRLLKTIAVRQAQFHRQDGCLPSCVANIKLNLTDFPLTHR